MISKLLKKIFKLVAGVALVAVIIKIGFTLKKKFELFKIKLLKIFRPPKYVKKYLIKSHINKNNKKKVISLIDNKNDVQLDFNDKLELLQYAINKNKNKVVKSLIKYLTDNITTKYEEFKKQEKKVQNLKEKINKIKNKKEKMEKTEDKWYYKITKIFYNKNYSKIQQDEERNLEIEKEKLNNQYKNIKENKKQLFCKNDDINKFIYNNRNNIINLNLRSNIEKLNNAILSINNLLTTKERNEQLAL